MPEDGKKAVVVLGIGVGIAGLIYLATRAKVASPPLGLIGDLNDDGAINALDLILLERYIAGLSVSTPLSDAEFRWRADVNEDGVVDALDISALEILIATSEG